MFLVNGGKLDDPLKLPADFKRGDPPYWNRLYRQNPMEVSPMSRRPQGLHRAGNHYGMGAAIGDYDNDGYPDIYVTNYGSNILYRNNDDGTFTNVD